MKCPMCIYDTGDSDDFENEVEYLFHLEGADKRTKPTDDGMYEIDMCPMHSMFSLEMCIFALQNKLEEKWEPITKDNWAKDVKYYKAKTGSLIPLSDSKRKEG